MDEQHKELLKCHRTRFLKCIDIDRLIPLLQTNGALTNDDVTDLKKYHNSEGKAEKLLDLLPSKGSKAFQAFCLALENTYPHLLTVMFLGGNKKMSGINDDIIRSPSSASQSLYSHQDVDLSQSILKTDLHVVSSERDSWRRSHSKSDRDNSYRRLTTSGDSMISSLSTLSKNHGVSTSDHSLNSNREYEAVHQVNDSHHRYTTNEFLHKQEISLRDSDFYHVKPKAATLKLDDQRHETLILKKQYNELLADKHRLEQEIERLKRFREEDRKEVNELQRQQEMLTENGGDAAHQLYLSVVRKCDAMKEEYDQLHKRYADLLASHGATVSKLEVTQEELGCWRKRYEDLAHERNAALHERNGLQQQCTAAIRQWDNALRERNEAREQLAKVQQQRDEAMKEINQAMAVRIKASKDLARLTEERNAAVQEYSLIMSERDTVHKEMERMQEELNEAQKVIKSSEGTSKTSAEEVESLRREISSALSDRDKALKECNDLREKYSDYVTGREEGGQRDKDWRKCEQPWDSAGRENSRKERENQWENDGMIKSHGQWLDDLDQANREIESLRRQVEKLQTELMEAQQEAEVCKRRRDWAFSERDKIVLERESIRSLCDKLRKERDRAVSDLAEALRDSDDVKRQKNEASKELKELREKIEAQQEKESRMKQLNSVGNNHSRDSAIDADMQEWDFENVEIALKFSSDEDLGLEFGGGKNDNQSGSDIFIRSIAKGSKAEGKLKVNDCILKINNVDVSNMDRKNAIETIQNCSGNVLLVVKRRRATNSRGVNNVILSVHGKHHGLIVENGVYISRITPGSVAAREGSIAVGDRLLAVNGKSIENVKGAGDLLDINSSTLTLQLSKCIPYPSSPPSSLSNYPNSESRADKKKGSNSGGHGRESVSSSPDKDGIPCSPKKPSLYEHDSEKSLKSGSIQIDHSKKSPENSPLSPITRRRKAASDDRTRYPSSQPTLLDRAYNKIFGEKRSSKEKKSPPNAHSPLLGHDEEDPIAELDSVLEIHSKPTKESSKKQEKNGGTWPKYKGPLIQYNEVGMGTVARYPSRKKSERKSLATVNKQFSLYNPAASQQASESRKNHLMDDCSDNENNSRLSVTMNSDRISVFVDCQHGHPSMSCSKKSSIPIISPSAGNVQTSSSGSSYASADIGSSHKTNLSGQSNEQLSDMRPPSYNGTSSPGSLLDYSVVSAYPNKDVLEYYKNRNRTRPRSALFGISDSECLSSLESNASSQCGKNLMSLDRTSFNHSDGIPLSFSPPDRPISAHSGHMYPVTVPTSLTASVISPNLLRSSTPFYTLSTEQRGMTHSHHPHNHGTGNHGNALVVSPLPNASRYSSPPGLSVYTSRSGDSLLSVSVTESMLVDARSFHSHTDNGRYSLKDSGRHSFSPSPSPCPSHYSYSNPSPTQSIDLHYHHGSSCQTPKRVVPAHAHVHTVYREDSYSPSVTDGLLTYPKRNQRIRIPSNPSVTSKSSAGKVSSSSIEKASSVSERSSPLPPFTVEWQNPDGSQALNDYRGRIAKPGDLRSICIEKTSEPLGIQISCGEGGGIFVSSVTKNSLAAQAGLQIGDHLLEVCGINMRSATYGLAANVLRQCMDSITMLVQYNPEKFREVVPENEDSSDGLQSPCETPVLSHKLSHSKSTTASNDDVASSPSSAASTLTKKKAAHSLTLEKRSKNSSKNPTSEPRLVILKKSTSNLGISLLGGNAVGIFVHALQDDSPAQGSNGLRSGDQILEYNGIDLRHATAEEAAYELAKPADTVKILALHNYERYQEIQDQPGDSFYIRSMFDRLSVNGSLAFQKDDILYVDNTMYNGVPGLWQAWLVDEEGEKIKCGFIPSKYKVEEELLMKRSLGDLEGSEGGRRGSTAARRSFFRRKRHHRSNSRGDSKELASFSDVSINSCSDSGTLGEELMPLTYQRVEKQHYESLRPVIVVGPLMEAVVEQLEQDFPIFMRCIPEKMKGSLSMMERGLQELKFVDFRRRGNHFECTTVTAIKQLCDKNCHALLDCSLSAVERLNQCMIYPIVIFLKYKSTKQIREVKDSRYLQEKVTTKAAKEMFEHALKIESEYKQLINAVIPGSNLTYMCTQVKSCVEEEQSKALWVPSGSL